MSFAPADYVAVADWLCKAAQAAECPPDAALRAAIGRYYYAALLSARDFIDQTETTLVDRTVETHTWVLRKLREYEDRPAQQLMVELNAMRTSRNAADYGDELPELSQEAERMAKRCSRALVHVATLTKRYKR